MSRSPQWILDRRRNEAIAETVHGLAWCNTFDGVAPDFVNDPEQQLALLAWLCECGWHLDIWMHTVTDEKGRVSLGDVRGHAWQLDERGCDIAVFEFAGATMNLALCGAAEWVAVQRAGD